MSKNSQHVVSNSRGGWDVKKSGAERASRHFNTQAEAVDWARTVAQKQKSELYIHGKDGRIREKSSYGKDPFPPKG